MFAGGLALESAHVVEAVADFDEDDADVVAHGQEQFFEVFGLCRGPVAEDAARDFGESVYDLCNFWAEDIFDVFHGVIGVFNYVV